MKFIDSNIETQQRIVENFGASEKILIAVAFWGKGSYEIIKRNKNKDIRIICNIESGATNPNEIVNIGNEIGFNRIRTNENLHSKIYFTDRSVILGSSNFSSNGLSLEGNETNKLIEANIEIHDWDVIKNIELWFENLWKQAKEIDEEYCQKYFKKWSENRNRNKPILRSYDFFEAYENGLYTNDNLYIIVDNEYFDDETYRLGKQEAKKQFEDKLFYKDQEIEFWWGFKNVPREAIVMNYFIDVEKRERISFEGLWCTLPKKYDRKNFQFCYKIKNNLVTKKHINQIKKILYQNRHSLNLLGKMGWTEKLSKFYKKYKES